MKAISIIIVISVVASFSVILKKYAKEYSLAVNILVGFAVIAYLVSNFVPVFNEIKNFMNLAKIPGKYSSVLFKSLGICFVTQFASDSCKDAGEISLASKVETVGKFAIVSIALPLFDEITALALKFMGAGPL